MKKLLLLIIVLFFTSSSTAYNFGTFTYQTSKDTVNRNVSFQLGLINPEDSSLDINLDADGLENGEVVFPRNNFALEPTEISENPEGEGWISIEPGKYAKVEKVSFWIIMDGKFDENFKVRVTAEKTNSDNTGIEPKTIQIRDYSYSINYPREESVRVSDGYERGDEDSDRGLEIIKSSGEDSDQVEQAKDEEFAVNHNSSENSSKTSKTNETSTSKQEGSKTTTILLSAGALASLVYLWTVI